MAPLERVPKIAIVVRMIAAVTIWNAQALTIYRFASEGLPLLLGRH